VLTGDDAKERIRQAINIVELIGEYVPLSRQGSSYKAICPFHDDTRPSLDVNPARQSWRCWVCDIGGDIFSFVMRREGLGFREALELLAERAGVELKNAPKTQPGSPNDRQTLLKAMAWAERQFYECLLHDAAAESARAYLDDRGINERSIHRFHLGYAPTEWQWLGNRARNSEFSPQVLHAAGLLRKNDKGNGGYYDYYRGRVMFSIRDTQNRPIACGGRILPDFADEKVGKYFNSPETKLFNKSQQLYALDLARDDAASKQSLIVVEGYTDVVMAHQFGLNNVVAVMGTALTEQHIQLLHRFTKQVYLVLDGDTAGQSRTSDVLDLFVAKDVDLRVVTLPEGQDPCDAIMSQGAEGFRRQLDGAVDALEHRFQTSMQGVDPARDTHRANQSLEEILNTLSKAPRVSTDSARQLRMHQMLARLSRLFRVDEADVRNRLSALQRSHRANSSGRRPTPNLAEAPVVASKRQYQISELTPMERDLFEVLIHAPTLVEEAKQKISTSDMGSETAAALFTILTQTRRSDLDSDFTAVLTQTDDFDLKSILVTLDAEAGKKLVHVQMDAPARLNDFIQQQAAQRVVARQQESGRAIENGEFASEADETQELSEYFSRLAESQRLARHRQGNSEPTDG